MPLRLSRTQAKAYGIKAPKAKAAPPRERFHGYLSGYEMQYAEVLEERRRRHEIRRWLYEGVTLRLATKVSYTPDFLAEYPNGSLTFFEIKGLKRPVGMVKLKVAARQFPFFKFILVTKVNGLWRCEPIAA